jgi:hypothetical protein
MTPPENSMPYQRCCAKALAAHCVDCPCFPTRKPGVPGSGAEFDAPFPQYTGQFLRMGMKKAANSAAFS